jgi:acetylornithine deacetylase/succinyl-diaminopimelate desuccinylase-like protein
MRGLALIALLAVSPAPASSADWLERNKPALLREYRELFVIPNVAADPAGIRRNADHIVRMMQQRGLSPHLLEDEDGKAPPLVYGEWRVPGARKTLILYAHYDGQPVTPSAWTVTKPFEPRLLSDRADHDGRAREIPDAAAAIGDEWRLYARGASDDKAGVMAILAAVETLKAQGKTPSVNLKIVFEGEEEEGSPHLAALLRRHKALLGSDGWVIVDGPAHQSGTPQLSLGVRGDVNVELTVYGPSRPLHSGHYGNWAPNPAMMLARLLASMKDETGRVTIKGFYDDVVPLTPSEKAAIAAVPAPDTALKQELALGWTEGGGAGLTELIQLPSLNINGLASADVGPRSRNVIPVSATAALDLRLVLGNTPERQVAKLADHVRAQGYQVFDREPTLEERRRYPKVATITHGSGYPAERTSLDHPLARDLARALRAKGPLVILPSLGGSLPLYVIRQELGAPTATLSLWNYDHNQHAEDENIRLGNLWNGIAEIEAVLTMDAGR